MLGKKHDDFKNVPLFIDRWTVKSVDGTVQEETEWEDTCDMNMNEISHIKSEKYLGQTISSDSTNTNNITELRNKGIGI